MSGLDDFDHWTQLGNAQPEPLEKALMVETIESAEPLDDQFGVDDPKAVPDAFFARLFGQPDSTATARDITTGIPLQASLLQTYAILDAAKVTNLPELLETSGLEHRCLFKGAAYDTQKDVAPWIVQLEEGSQFTRNLFTRSPAPWHLWDAEAGIFLRSHKTLDELWKHFRKFTKVRDEKGKWLYWRFWEGGFLVPTLRATETEQLKLFFFDGYISSFHIVIADQKRVLTLRMEHEVTA